jgi:hypothetical protein
MSVSYEIVLDKPSKKVQRLIKRFEGDALPRWKKEAEVSVGLGLTPLAKFVCMTPDGAREYVEFLTRLGRDTSGVLDTYREHWFEPSEGLATVRGLIRAVESDDQVDPWLDRQWAGYVLADLKDLEAILVAAETEGVRFHLTG